MAGYSALNQNTTASTYTIAAKGVSSTATVDYAKTGAGAARVTLMNPVSNDNYLSGLTSNIGIWEKEFDPTITEYKLFTSMYEDEVTLTATAHSSSATVTGDGVIDVKLGYNYINIVVTAPNGETKTYQITIVREGLKGRHSSELERVVNTSNGDIIKVKKNKYNYSTIIYSYQLYLNLEIVPYDEDATYVVEGNDLILEDGIITITVSAPGVQDSIYYISYTIQNVGAVASKDVGIKSPSL